jgi:hypothetical protein
MRVISLRDTPLVLHGVREARGLKSKARRFKTAQDNGTTTPQL